MSSVAFVSWRHRTSGFSSRSRRSTMPIRARTAFTFHEAILIVSATGERLASSSLKANERPPLRGLGARADQAFVTQGIKVEPRVTGGNPGQPTEINASLRLPYLTRGGT